MATSNSIDIAVRDDLQEAASTIHAFQLQRSENARDSDPVLEAVLAKVGGHIDRALMRLGQAPCVGDFEKWIDSTSAMVRG
jgi:hypothetical protein